MNIAARIQIIFAGCFMFCLTGFFWHTLDWNQNNQLLMLSKSVAVPATVKSIAIVDSQMESTHGGTSTVYEPVISYSYTVDGHEYETSHWRLNQVKTGVRSWAENDAKQFQVGQLTKAYVDPRDPSNAVLVHSLDLILYGVSIVISIFVLFGLELILMGIIPVRDGTLASPPKELIFDFPCLVWFLVNGQKLYQYFSNSSDPHSIWSYVFVVVWLLFTAFLVKCRVDFRTTPAGATKIGGQVRGLGSLKPNRTTVFDTRTSSKVDSENEQIGTSGRTFNQSKLPAWSSLASLIPLAIFLGMGAYQVYTVATWGDKTNPELATVYSKEKALEAIPEHNQDVKKEPDNPWAYKNRGLNYFDAEEYSKAIDDLTVTLSKIKTPDWQTLWCRARAYVLTGQWQKASADYQAMLKCEHKPFDIYCSRRGMGICDYHLKKYKEAAENFTLSLDSNGTGDHASPELWHDRALCYQHLGQAALAEKDFKAVPFWRSSQYWLQ